MSNNKDFVVNGPVVIGKDTKVTVGSITSSDIDLSTGNYFDDTLVADTTYTISNPGVVQAFQLEVTGFVIEYNLSGVTLDSGQTLSFSANETSPSMGAISTDGTKVYVAGTAGVGSIVYQYNLSTPYDLTTGSLASQKTVTSEASSPDALTFSYDGTKMYVGQNTVVYQYTLSTPWVVSTASYDSKTLSIVGVVVGLSISSDGTKFYSVRNGTPDTIYQYTLSTANDISTATGGGSINVDSIETSCTSGAINSDGTKFYIMSRTQIHELNLSTAYDITTAVYNSVSFTHGLSTVEGSGLASTDQYFILMASDDDTFRRVSMTASDATLTWPTSIEWAGGVAPSAPANGETDVYTFTTDDGGTTYTGVKSIDNAS